MAFVKVAFVCAQHSCCLHLAMALGNHFASDVFDSYGVESHPQYQVNQDAVRLMKDLYSISLEETKYDKQISDLDAVDVIITMGCDVVGLPTQYQEDWKIEDPTGKNDEEFIAVIQKIEEKIFELKQTIDSNEQFQSRSA